MNGFFIPKDLADKLKAKGYPMPTNVVYATYKRDGKLCPMKIVGETISKESVAPTIEHVLKWLIEKKKIFVAINIGYCYESDEIPFPTNPKMEPILKGYYYGIWELDNLNDKNARSEYFEAPEFAILAGIEYVIDNLI